jgi:hypothetical protein
MRYIFLAIVGVVLLSSCKKVVEQVQLNALMKLITSGQWKVTTYKKDVTDITSQFAAYRFQFKEEGTVDAIIDSRVDKTGTWSGNTTNMSIQSSFGAVEAPLSLLNGTWYVTKTSLTFVESNQQVNGETLFLRLDKL